MSKWPDDTYEKAQQKGYIHMELCTSNTWICDTISCIICYFPIGLKNISIWTDLNLVYITDICKIIFVFSSLWFSLSRQILLIYEAWHCNRWYIKDYTYNMCPTIPPPHHFEEYWLTRKLCRLRKSVAWLTFWLIHHV